MKLCLFARAAFGVFLLLLAASITTQAAEIKLLTSPGFGPVFQDVGPAFERATGHQLSRESIGLGIIIKRVNNGETFDVVMAPRTAIDGFVKSGKAAVTGVTVVAIAGMAVAVRHGAPKPDLSSPDAFKRTLLTAKSISYPDSQNPSGNALLGRHLEQVFERLGIAGENEITNGFFAHGRCR